MIRATLNYRWLREATGEYEARSTCGHKLRERGAELISCWLIKGYDFAESQALEDGMFIGLALDDGNEPQLTAPRSEAWVTQIVTELQLELTEQPAGVCLLR